VSMRDRIGALGGTLELGSAPGRGTTVRGRVPGCRRDEPPDADGP
jgi:signal transduction histidine kinase